MLLLLVLFIGVVSIPFSYGHACFAKVHACMHCAEKPWARHVTLTLLTNEMLPWKCAIKLYWFGPLIWCHIYISANVKLIILRSFRMYHWKLNAFATFQRSWCLKWTDLLSSCRIWRQFLNSVWMHASDQFSLSRMNVKVVMYWSSMVPMCKRE